MNGLTEMDFLNLLALHYNWQLSLEAGLGIVALTLAGRVLRLIPAVGSSRELNETAFLKKMKRPSYAENQRWSRRSGTLVTFVIFVAIVPFVLTDAKHSALTVAGHLLAILLVYDFFYYLMHRFLFHDSKALGGPLLWVHAVHHRQHNPCRMDSSYIHPIEVAMGLGLFAATVLGLSFLLGSFSLVTFVIAWVGFLQINLHNHALWETDKFPFKLLKYMSKMHHNHHAQFTAGNFGTISMLYDWMFGTLDYGKRGKSALVADDLKNRQSQPG